jgi:inorganic pyrophosphatase
MPQKPSRLLTDLDALRGKDDNVNVIIETPKGSRNKLDYDPELGVFELSGVMPEGSVFPYDFGFLPSTLGEDGDPLDVLVLMDAPVPVGCLVSTRLIGVVEAEQTETDGSTMRNDRLLGVATHAHTHEHVQSHLDLRPKMLDEIEHFFASYNQIKGKTFKPVRRGGPSRAMELVHEGVARNRREHAEAK